MVWPLGCGYCRATNTRPIFHIIWILVWQENTHFVLCESKNYILNEMMRTQRTVYAHIHMYTLHCKVNGESVKKEEKNYKSIRFAKRNHFLVDFFAYFVVYTYTKHAYNGCYCYTIDGWMVIFDAVTTAMAVLFADVVEKLVEIPQIICR